MSFSLVNVRINTSTSLYQTLHYTQSVWRMATLKSSAISFFCLCVRFYKTACVSKARKNLSSQSAYSYISHHFGKKSSIAPTCVSESLIYTCTSNFNHFIPSQIWKYFWFFCFFFVFVFSYDSTLCFCYFLQLRFKLWNGTL